LPDLSEKPPGWQAGDQAKRQIMLNMPDQAEQASGWQVGDQTKRQIKQRVPDQAEQASGWQEGDIRVPTTTTPITPVNTLCKF